MKHNWEVKKLGEVCSFLNRGISPKYVEKGGVCVLNQKCIRDHSVGYEQSRRHDSKIKSVSPDRFIKVGDVLVNSTGTGTLGRVAQVRTKPSEPTTVDSHVTIVRPEGGLFSPEFFGYMLIFIEEEIKTAGEGCGGQTELARSVLAERFNVHYPKSLPEQKRIVAILDKAFAAIARAKENAEKNLANARELFESYLQGVFANPSTTLGASPGDGWEEKKLGEVCKFVRGPFGGSLKKNIFKPDGYAVYEQQHAIYDQFIDVRYFIDKNKFNEMKRFELNPGDLIMSCSGTMGKMAIVPENMQKGIINQALLKLTPSNIISTVFLKLWMQSNSFQESLKAYSQGAAIQNVASVKILKEIKMPIPSINEQKRIVTTLDILSTETQKLESIYRQKLADLDELKKSILQKAFAGEL